MTCHFQAQTDGRRMVFYRAGPSAPVASSGSPDYKFKRIFGAAAESYFCGILWDNTAACWGTGSDGQLGIGTFDSTSTPTALEPSLKFAMLSLGIQHTCGLLRNSSAMCWVGLRLAVLSDLRCLCPTCLIKGKLLCTSLRFPEFTQCRARTTTARWGRVCLNSAAPASRSWWRHR